MSQQLVIDGLGFARDHGSLDGEILVSDLSRLHDLVADVSGAVQYSLYGSHGGRGQAQVRVVVKGCLHLVCQRCLQSVDYKLDVDEMLVLVPDGVELTQEELEDDSRDFLPMAEKLNVGELVEEEIILSLPVVPKHDDCGLPGASEAGGVLSPFAVLEALKGKPN